MTEQVSSELLHQAILQGAHRTRANRDELNRINVFPVVDNDTGTNLAHTMHAIEDRSRAHGDVRSTLRDVARSALIGARGNSGAIFSQYFHGLSLQGSDKGSVTLSELASYFKEAYEKAYRAIENPVEGTVITLMRAWYVGYQEALDLRRTPHEALEHALDGLHAALQETRRTMKRLKASSVVDAGALGYYHFMSGFVQTLLGKAEPLPAETAADRAEFAGGDVHRVGEGAEIPFRYCTEVLLEAPGLDAEALREDLRELGDCLLVSASDDLARVHLHTSRPWEMVRAAAARGRILEHKADDMVAQNRLAGPHTHRTAVVTDSIADLPQEWLFEHGVYQLPINVLLDGVDYQDKITIDGAYLNEHLAGASSSQLNAEQARAFFAPILAHHERVLVLTVSSRMSGTHQRVREALEALGADGKRAVLVDTKTNSGAQGLLVREAVLRLEADEALESVVAAVEELRGRARILVSVDDIAPMARSGRVSERIGRLLIRLRFKPLISIDAEGNGTIQGIAFSRRKNWKLLLRSLRRRSIEEYVVVHAGAPERAERLREDLVRMTGREPLYITGISAVVTLFAGVGSVAAAFVETPRDPSGRKARR